MIPWLLRGGCVALAALLPWLMGWPAALLLLILTPAVVECAREAGESYTAAAVCAALAASCMLTLPAPGGFFTLGWCALGLIMCLRPAGHCLKRALVWTCGAAVTTCALLVWLNAKYDGMIFAGLAQSLTDALMQRDDAAQILLQCYQMGLSRLENDLAPAVQLFGMLVMSRGVQQELLNSLRYTLEISLQSLLPQIIVLWLLLTAVSAVALPDAVRRKRGLAGRLPQFGDWALSDKAISHLNALVLVYFVQLLIPGRVMGMMGSLCVAAFQYAYMLLGMAVLEGIGRRIGTARVIRRLWIIVSVLFAPFLLLIFGLADRWFDLRKLRRLPDDEGGY